MKHKTRLIICTIMVLLMAPLALHAANLDKIKLGMTTDQVTYILGRPISRSFNEDVEVLTFQFFEGGKGIFKIGGSWVEAVVTFKDGRVVQMDSYPINSSSSNDNAGSAYPNGNRGYGGLPPYQQQRQPYYRYYGYEPLDKASFQRLMGYYNKESFDDDKLKILNVAALGCFFTCDQCRQIMKTYTFDDDRLKVARILLPRVVDLENVHILYSLFTFDSGRQELDKILNSISKQGL